MRRLFCLLGRHQMDGCVCTQCGFGEHEMDGCVCSQCHFVRDPNRADMAGHSWNGCLCRKCRVWRDKDHQWDACLCSRCGRSREPGHHRWTDGACNHCGVRIALVKEPERERYPFGWYEAAIRTRNGTEGVFKACCEPNKKWGLPRPGEKVHAYQMRWTHYHAEFPDGTTDHFAGGRYATFLELAESQVPNLVKSGRRSYKTFLHHPSWTPSMN